MDSVENPFNSNMTLSISLNNVTANDIVCNPAVDDIDEEMLEKMKGDAIGNTMYSERYVLATVLQLQDKKWTPKFEQDLCMLWDMTADKEVIDFLSKHNFISLSISEIISVINNNNRLTEILVGIIANMCTSPSVLQSVIKDETALSVLINLISIPCSETLIQLMRFINLACRVENNFLLYNCIVKTGNFFDSFAFVLNSSTQDELLLCTLRTLQVMLHIEIQNGNSNTLKLFLNNNLFKGIIESYREIKKPSDDFFERGSDVKRDLLFLDILNNITTIFSEYSSENYISYLNSYIITALDEIYASISHLTKKEYLFPIDDIVLTFLYNVKSIVISVKIFHIGIFSVILSILLLLSDIKSDNEELRKDLKQLIHEMLTYIDDCEVVINYFKHKKQISVYLKKLINSFEVYDMEKNCKIRLVIETLKCNI